VSEPPTEVIAALFDKTRALPAFRLRTAGEQSVANLWRSRLRSQQTSSTASSPSPSPWERASSPPAGSTWPTARQPSKPTAPRWRSTARLSARSPERRCVRLSACSDAGSSWIWARGCMSVLSNRFAEARAAVAEARRLVVVGSDLVGRASASDLPAVAVAAKAVLACYPQSAVGPSPDGSAIATADPAAAIEGSVPQLVTSVDQLRNAASQELSRREDTWRPHALALAKWLPMARKARTAAESLPGLKAAAAPFWDQLRLQSNISLEDVHPGGAGKARKVPLRVTVDGQEGAALGVMSQGEVHPLALRAYYSRLGPAP
jgi:hypothetical protein